MDKPDSRLSGAVLRWNRSAPGGASAVRMSLKVRSILVLVVGTVLGLGVSLGSNMLTALEARRAAAAEEPTREYVELLAEVVERVKREYVEGIDDRRLIEAAIRGMVEELD